MKVGLILKTICSIRQVVVLDQEVVIFFCKGLYSKYYRFCRP